MRKKYVKLLTGVDYMVNIMVTNPHKHGNVICMALAKYNVASLQDASTEYDSMDVEVYPLGPGEWFHILLAPPNYRCREPIEIARIAFPDTDTVLSVFDMRTVPQSQRGGRKPFGSSKHIYGDFLLLHEEDVTRANTEGLKGVWHAAVEPGKTVWLSDEPDPERRPAQEYPGLLNDCRNGLGLPSSTSECLVLIRGEYGREVQVSYDIPRESDDNSYDY